MSRPDCISNRNIRIIAMYVSGRLGTYHALFEGLSYPDEYPCAEDFFLNEDEWTSHENFDRILRKAKKLVDEPDFFFKCGFSSATLRSWGRFNYFVRVFATPNDGYRRLPFFNNNFNDTKEIEIVLPPTYDNDLKKIRTVLKIRFHDDFDPNSDYIGDPYLRGIISSIPTIWGIAPATIRQPLLPYDPEILFNQDPEFAGHGLNVKIEGRIMSLWDPGSGQRINVGEKVLLESEKVNNEQVFLGKYTRMTPGSNSGREGREEGMLVTRTVESDNRVLLAEGDILMAPYYILDVSYDRISFFNRLSQVFQIRKIGRDSGQELIETVNQLRKSMMAKNEACLVLEKTNKELRDAKARLDEYNKELENRVKERTSELREAQETLLRLNSDLEGKVNEQVIEIERYNQLRRYLSPKLTEKILSSDHTFGTEPQRKMMTVVFTDIRGFSGLTDDMEPEELFQLLTDYLSEMVKIVHYHDGTLNKIVGDGLLIFFGDPIPMEDHAARAVRMAIQMQEKVEDLKDGWSQYGHELGVGIGINSGFMTVGNVGSDMHRDYTVIGNQVNVAARLETAAKAGEILISQRTNSKVEGLVDTKEVDEIRVKGIHNLIKTFKVTW